MTPPFRNILLWLRRFRHRCGYGVHSPFAFSLLEEVVYERLPYYAFPELDACLEWQQRWRVRRYLHLLFRLANYQHPSHIFLSTDAHKLEKLYLLSPCRHVEVQVLGGEKAKSSEVNGESADESRKNSDEYGENRIIFLAKPDDDALPLLTPRTMLLLANVHRYSDWWKGLPSVVSFDLYDLGIAFFDTKYNKQEYVVNF